MTAHTESDPTPEQPWIETSTAGMRRLALQATEAAIRAAKERRERQYGAKS